MLWGLFGRKRKPLSFPALEASGKEKHYLYRICRFSRVGGSLRVFNSDHVPSIIPLTPWEAKIFELAGGIHTLGQLVHTIADQYQNPKLVPDKLDVVILELLEVMIKDRRILDLSDTPIELPYYLSMAVEDQDEAKAKKLMLKDRFKD